jgi:hypothetical protein
MLRIRVRPMCLRCLLCVHDTLLHALARLLGGLSSATVISAFPISLSTHQLCACPSQALASCIARSTGTPIVFVGSIPIDAPVLLLHPAKKDWASLHQLGLAQVWAGVEASQYAQQLATRPRDPFHFLPLADLARSCPSARCDGMHFGSDYHTFQCHSTLAVWYPFLVTFLRRSGLLSQAEGRRQRCLALRAERSARSRDICGLLAACATRQLPQKPSPG